MCKLQYAEKHVNGSTWIRKTKVPPRQPQSDKFTILERDEIGSLLSFGPPSCQVTA